MNAKEAKKLTRECILKVDVTDILKKIYAKVKEAAEEGENSIVLDESI